MNRILIIAAFLICSFESISQTNVYVSVSSLNLRSSSSTSSEVLSRLIKYDNLIVSDTLNGDWLKVEKGQYSGYVHKNFVKSGTAKVSTITGGRIGAICKDGTYSSATGRGACSHHGGVSTWRYSERERVEVIDN